MVMRGSREAMRTDESAGSDRPVSAFQTSGPPTAAVPCVMSTTARPSTRSTSAAATAAAPVREVTADGVMAGVVAVTAMVLLLQGGDDRVDVLVHRLGTAEHRDAVGQSVDVALLHERQRGPHLVLGQGAGERRAVLVAVVGDVGELDVTQLGEALDVGGAEAVGLVALDGPGVLQAELLAWPRRSLQLLARR